MGARRSPVAAPAVASLLLLLLVSFCKDNASSAIFVNFCAFQWPVFFLIRFPFILPLDKIKGAGRRRWLRRTAALGPGRRRCSSMWPSSTATRTASSPSPRQKQVTTRESSRYMRAHDDEFFDVFLPNYTERVFRVLPAVLVVCRVLILATSVMDAMDGF